MTMSRADFVALVAAGDGAARRPRRSATAEATFSPAAVSHVVMRPRPTLAYAAAAPWRASWRSPGAATRCSTRRRRSAATPVPAGSAADRGTAIPDDFPLSAGMGGPQDTIATSRTGTGLRDLALCGTSPAARPRPARPDGRRQQRRRVGRHPRARPARRRRRGRASWPGPSPTCRRTATSPAVSGDTETLTEVRASPFGPAPATTLLQTYTFDGAPGDGATVIHVVPVGAAVLVTSTYGQWTPERPRRGGRRDRRAAARDRRRDGRLRGGRRDDGLVRHDVLPGADPVTRRSDRGPRRLPPGDRPPRRRRRHDAVAARERRRGDGRGRDVRSGRSGRSTAPPAAPAGWSPRAVGPEYFDGRELVVHADEEVAANAMAVLRQAAQDCRTSGNQVWTVLDARHRPRHRHGGPHLVRRPRELRSSRSPGSARRD